MSEDGRQTDDRRETKDDRATFSAALSARLEGRSARELAPKVFSGRTVVNEIKSGRRLPSEQQLDALLREVGADEAERAAWTERLRSVRPVPAPPASPSVAPAVVSPAVTRSAQPRRRLVAAAVVILALVVVAAVLLTRRGAAGGVQVPSNEVPIVPAGSPAPSGSSSGSSSPSSKGGSAAGTIDYPADGTTAGSAAGVRLSGTFAEDSVASYWLVDRDADGTYTVAVPVTRVNGTSWKAVDQPLADPADLPDPVTILLVRADDGCAARFRAAAAAEDSTLPRLGTGCQIVDQVTITVDRP